MQVRAKYFYEFRDSCLLCLTETWLNDTIDNDIIEIPGFSAPIRLDRDTVATGKSIGGGVCIYVNERWCKDYSIKMRICTKDIELLTVSFRPFYLPREFGQIFITLVYIPPDANTNKACDIIFETTQQLERLSTDAPKLVLGDFNSCTLRDTLPRYYQFVDCATRNKNTIDLCYGNIQHAYKATARSPLGGSDHNSVLLTPSYRQKLKTIKPTSKTLKCWTADSLQELKGCFECIDWSVFEACENFNEKAETITDYINFCVDNVIPQKTITIYPNNKPWITKELKLVLNEKKRAFCAGDKTEVKAVQKKITTETKKCKDKYREKIEKQFAEKDLRHAWSGVKTMIGATKKRKKIQTEDNAGFANDLNAFYARFDCHDFSNERKSVLDSLPDMSPPIITESDVAKSFCKINPRKACGPDNIMGIVLRECKYQLAQIFRELFQTSLDTHEIPTIWKTSNIIPVPKNSNPTVLNDYRPVALTSVAMKCLEHIVKTFLMIEVQKKIDPLQFAYTPKRGVDDATLILLQNIVAHLDTPKAYCRLLFIDFSSAFNTIQPYLLLKKLAGMNVNTNIITWIDAFMQERSQFVTVNGTKSTTLHISTGAPQGCVISPILFILYTNDCLCGKPDCLLVKFADDTIVAGFLKGDESQYRDAISNLSQWCDSNFLHLNAKKTKELVIDFRTQSDNLQPVLVNSEEIEQVTQYKYLGTIIDNKLNFKANTDYIYKKGQQRLHFLRCLRQFGVDKTIMSLFYKTFILPVLCFNFITWYSGLAVQNKNKLARIVNVASKIIGIKQDNLDSLFRKQTLSKVEKIMEDRNHLLHHRYRWLPLGKRLRSEQCKTNRTLRAFVPVSIRLYNSANT